jgi:outer membrane protein assembly factor BamB
MRRTTLITALLTLLSVMAVPAAADSATYPDVISLPNGFQPEGVAVGNGHEIYAGSLADGRIVRADLRTGEVEEVIGANGVPAVGMDYDRRSGYLFVAGGPIGTGYVYDTEDGSVIAELTLGVGFVNDVIVTRSAAYFTNSFAPEIYRMPLGANGLLEGSVETIALSGFGFIPGAFNANGIEATSDGGTLFVVNSTEGVLYTVDPSTGTSAPVDLGGASLTSGDGIVLEGRTMYVVQNRLNQIAVVELSPDFASGEVVETITSDAFRIPTTADVFGKSLYAVNARFGTPPTPDTEYEIVRVTK